MTTPLVVPRYRNAKILDSVVTPLKRLIRGFRIVRFIMWIRNSNNSVKSIQYCAGVKIEKNEVGGEFGAYGGGERCAQGSSGETRGKETIGETQK